MIKCRDAIASKNKNMTTYSIVVWEELTFGGVIVIACIRLIDLLYYERVIEVEMRFYLMENVWRMKVICFWYIIIGKIPDTLLFKTNSHNICIKPLEFLLNCQRSSKNVRKGVWESKWETLNLFQRMEIFKAWRGVFGILSLFSLYKSLIDCESRERMETDYDPQDTTFN